MNEDRISGNRKQLRGKVREQWGELTGDDMGVAERKRDPLAGSIQERYGDGREQAEKSGRTGKTLISSDGRNRGTRIKTGDAPVFFYSGIADESRCASQAQLPR